MERGTRDCSTWRAARDHGIAVYPIVTVREILAFLHNREIDGRVYIDDAMRAPWRPILAEYGPRA
jgi:orotate phosphoribosyltransferase